MSSPSSSDSSSPSSSPTLGKFDPFAVHPFTNCSANKNGSDPHKNAASAYPYGAPFLNYPTRGVQPPQTSPLYMPSPTSPSTKQRSSTSHSNGIFVPFRQDTSSPDLAAVLKPNKSK